MEIFDIIAIIILSLLMITSLFIHFRNEKVSAFRRQIIQEDYDDTMQNVDNGILENVDNYSKLPSYNRMVFSFKPLTKKYWL